ncbi:MAG: carboxypeptidase-like regulatory domain-containing protein [Fuerstiella sp.]
MHRCGIVLFCGILLTSMGCGGGAAEDYPDMGRVSGTVTLGGSPVSGASIAFQPTEVGGRASSAMTDANGYYTLQYSANMEGAKVGEHSVRISTYQPEGPGEDGELVDAVPETIPNQYNTKSTLKQTVAQGSNTFDFELSAEGEIDKHEGESYEDGDE